MNADTAPGTVGVANETCCVCMERVTGRFGILPYCNHSYCVDCITNWRRSLSFDKEVRWGCPVCRVEAPFVMRSTKWLEEGSAEKNGLIEKRKTIMSKQACWYNSKGACPYANCLYSHKVCRGWRTYENRDRDNSLGHWPVVFVPLQYSNVFVPQQHVPPLYWSDNN